MIEPCYASAMNVQISAKGLSSGLVLTGTGIGMLAVGAVRVRRSHWKWRIGDLLVLCFLSGVGIYLGILLDTTLKTATRSTVVAQALHWAGCNVGVGAVVAGCVSAWANHKCPRRPWVSWAVVVAISLASLGLSIAREKYVLAEYMMRVCETEPRCDDPEFCQVVPCHFSAHPTECDFGRSIQEDECQTAVELLLNKSCEGCYGRGLVRGNWPKVPPHCSMPLKTSGRRPLAYWNTNATGIGNETFMMICTRPGKEKDALNGIRINYMGWISGVFFALSAVTWHWETPDRWLMTGTSLVISAVLAWTGYTTGKTLVTTFWRIDFDYHQDQFFSAALRNSGFASGLSNAIAGAVFAAVIALKHHYPDAPDSQDWGSIGVVILASVGSMAICFPASVFSVMAAKTWSAAVEDASQMYDSLKEIPLRRLPGRDDPQENPITFMWMTLTAAFVTLGWSGKRLLTKCHKKREMSDENERRDLRPTLKMILDLQAPQSEIELEALGSDAHRRSV